MPIWFRPLIFFYYSTSACIIKGILNYTNAIRSHQMMFAHIYLIFSNLNKVICMIDRRVREMDMNAFCCLYESEKKT
jgi:hypothetical protein